MPRIGVNASVAGGAVTSLQSKVTINGVPILISGSSVASHGTGDHASATMVDPGWTLTINGVTVIIEGDSASCGHLLATPPQSKVFLNEQLIFLRMIQ